MALIKPSRRGLLHEEMGIPQGEKIGRARLEAAKSGAGPAKKRRIQFALNFNKRAGGQVDGEPATGRLDRRRR